MFIWDWSIFYYVGILGRGREWELSRGFMVSFRSWFLFYWLGFGFLILFNCIGDYVTLFFCVFRRGNLLVRFFDVGG